MLKSKPCKVKKYLNNQRGVTHIFLLLVVIVAVAIGTYLLLTKVFQVNLPSVPGITQEPKVTVKTEYQNPLKKETQYVNPFDQYKSPLVNLKK